MKLKYTYILPFMIAIILVACSNENTNSNLNLSENELWVVSAMKKVMWSGQLEGKINLDTIPNKKGLQGIGPVSYLTGEILIIDGKSYVSKVTSDSTMQVEETFNTSAPFFVYSNVSEWEEIEITDEITNMKSLENFIEKKSIRHDGPFAFKILGKINEAIIHVQNLPPGTTVSSPKEAHQGQVNYNLKNEDVSILGFFSKEHKGIFTHHDSFMHLHLITIDKTKMGHLDQAVFENITLFLPRNN